MKSKFNKGLLSFLLIMSCFIGASAQKRDVPVPGTNGPPPPGFPIDGGLSYLLIAGIAYGVYELKRKK
ncbi:MAG: hypothetical protein QM495_05635 [Lutibacter sp.]|uniref:PID-CTERM protein-sorting domain-containing protein n=1 Tax=Lutibacter sp. TaxID=1925666 RepID=UPI003859D54E